MQLHCAIAQLTCAPPCSASLIPAAGACPTQDAGELRPFSDFWFHIVIPSCLKRHIQSPLSSGSAVLRVGSLRRPAPLPTYSLSDRRIDCAGAVALPELLEARARTPIVSWNQDIKRLYAIPRLPEEEADEGFVGQRPGGRNNLAHQDQHFVHPPIRQRQHLHQ
jgi:hypothetical protein